MENPYRRSVEGRASGPGLAAVGLWLSALVLLGGAALFSLECLAGSLLVRAFGLDEGWGGVPVVGLMAWLLARLVRRGRGAEGEGRRGGLAGAVDAAVEAAGAGGPGADLRGPDELAPGELRARLALALPALIGAGWMVAGVLGHVPWGDGSAVHRVAGAMASDSGLAAVVIAAGALSLAGVYLTARWGSDALDLGVASEERREPDV